MAYLTCNLKIISDKSLEEVAAIISERLLGGVRLVGRDEHIYDEVPAIFSAHDILGLRIILQGYGGSQGYFLEMRDRKPLNSSTASEQIRSSVVDLSPNVACLLQGIDDLRVIVPRD